MNEWLNIWYDYQLIKRLTICWFGGCLRMPPGSSPSWIQPMGLEVGIAKAGSASPGIGNWRLFWLVSAQLKDHTSFLLIGSFKVKILNALTCWPRASLNILVQGSGVLYAKEVPCRYFSQQWACLVCVRAHTHTESGIHLLPSTHSDILCAGDADLDIHTDKHTHT